MKAWPVVVLLSVIAFIPAAHGVELKLPSCAECVVSSDAGQEVLRVPVGSVGVQVSADGQEFLLSFGEDANGLLVAVLSPAPSNPKSISVKIGAGIPDLVAVESGLIGNLKVNKRTIPPGMRWAPGTQADAYYLDATDESTATVYWRCLDSPTQRPIPPSPDTDPTNLTGLGSGLAPGEAPMSGPDGSPFEGGGGMEGAAGEAPFPNGGISAIPIPSRVIYHPDDVINPVLLNTDEPRLGDEDEGDDDKEETTKV